MTLLQKKTPPLMSIAERPICGINKRSITYSSNKNNNNNHEAINKNGGGLIIMVDHWPTSPLIHQYMSLVARWKFIVCHNVECLQFITWQIDTISSANYGITDSVIKKKDHYWTALNIILTALRVCSSTSRHFYRGLRTTWYRNLSVKERQILHHWAQVSEV